MIDKKIQQNVLIGLAGIVSTTALGGLIYAAYTRYFPKNQLDPYKIPPIQSRSQIYIFGDPAPGTDVIGFTDIEMHLRDYKKDESLNTKNPSQSHGPQRYQR